MANTVLHIDSSIGGDASRSRAISQSEVDALIADTVIRRDLVAEPLPYIDGIWAETRLKAPEDLTHGDKQILALSDRLIGELRSADTIVIGLPIYNFSASASLKAWMDLVARPRVTFRYTENGPEGLLKGKKAIVVVASGGVPVGSEMDFASRHMKVFLNFIGIDDISVVDVKQIAQAA